jgi:hypothetical protein
MVSPVAFAASRAGFVVVAYQPIESNYLIQVGEPIHRPSEVSRCSRFLCQQVR